MLKKWLRQYHFESKESIEASLVIDPSDDEAPLFPSFIFAEISPMCEGFHEES